MEPFPELGVTPGSDPKKKVDSFSRALHSTARFPEIDCGQHGNLRKTKGFEGVKVLLKAKLERRTSIGFLCFYV